MITPIHFMWAAIAVSIVIGGLIVAAFIADWRRDARAGRHASIPEAAPAAPGAPAVHHENPGPPAEFLAAPAAAPEWHHDEYAPSSSRYDGHASAPGGILIPPLAVALAAVTTLRGLAEAAIAGGAGQAEAEARRLREKIQRLEDERDFPHLAGPGFADWSTGQFAAVDAELVRAAMERAEEPAVPS